MAYKPFECMMTHSSCYKGTKKMQVLGVLWHSTGANNTWLKRYVQPYAGDKDYDKKLAKLGKNSYNNDWNHIEKDAGLNCWIGKFADGTVGTVQTMPWDFRPWGCGTRYKNGGSCNDGWIQFEICEDNLKDKAYAEAVWNEAVQLTAYLCKMFNLDPFGEATHKSGKKVPVILDHKTSWELGLGSGHGDIRHWFPKILGKDMADARKEVKAILDGDKPQPTPTPTPTPTPGKWPAPPFQITVKESGKTGMRDAGYSSGEYLGTVGAGTYTVTALSGDFGKIDAGWVYLIDANITVGTPKSLDGYTVGKFYTVCAKAGLNLRKSIGGGVIKVLKYGTVVMCTDIQRSGSNTYIQIADSSGWCAAKYNGDVYVK